MIETLWCPLRGVTLPVEQCVDSCPAPEQRVTCAMELNMKHEAQVKRTPLPTDTEGLFQGWVVHTARERGYLVQITLRRMRRGVNSQPGGGGWPDLMFVGRGRVFWAELKTTEGYLKPDQVRTIEVMRQNGAEVFVWTPADYEAVLTALA